VKLEEEKRIIPKGSLRERFPRWQSLLEGGEIFALARPDAR